MVKNKLSALITNASRVIIGIGYAVSFAGASACACAENGNDLSEITDPINNGLGTVFNAVRVVATAIAIVVAAFTGIKMLVGDARSMENGKATLFKIVAAVAIIWLAPLLIKNIVGLFSNVSGNDWNSVVG